MAKFRALHSEFTPLPVCHSRCTPRFKLPPLQGGCVSAPNAPLANAEIALAEFSSTNTTNKRNDSMNTVATQPPLTPTLTVTPIGRTGRNVDLNRVMSFQFDPLVYRMVDKYKWTETESRECFEDLKRFLYMAVIADKPVAPTEKLDEMWHNFILYTMDYAEFCTMYLGMFVHHRPRRRDDPKSTRNMRQETLDFARELFGHLPTHFHYTHAEMFKASNDCVNSCSHSAPSTNCQS
jgi:hypothetical protein